MKIRSDSFENGARIDAQYAAGARTDGSVGFGGNRNPHLAWSDVPSGTQSFALLCIDPDVPTDAAPHPIPRDQPRTDFIHWVMVDIPAGVTEIAAGSCSDSFQQGGKATPPGPAGARQGSNSYTAYFEGNPAMAGTYRGYDGPYPPPHDERLHRYAFRVFALDVATLEVGGDFEAGDVLRAMQGHVLGEASVHGTYSLNADVRE